MHDDASAQTSAVVEITISALSDQRATFRQ
jgi:hypothetical protein